MQRNKKAWHSHGKETSTEIASEGTTMLVLAEEYFNVTTIKIFKNVKETIF